MEQMISNKYSQLPQSDFICSKGVYTQDELEKLKNNIVGKPVKNAVGYVIGKTIEAELKDGKLFVVYKMNDNSFYKTCLFNDGTRT